ncbi:hypothetical protein GQ53DRAFT_441357 [Thozetella sp. PMI_491]|nr:hypothetical protein GQ53DRAFT_441357 [Thozetella sp. PMI_491]
MVTCLVQNVAWHLPVDVFVGVLVALFAHARQGSNTIPDIDRPQAPPLPPPAFPRAHTRTGGEGSAEENNATEVCLINLQGKIRGGGISRLDVTGTAIHSTRPRSVPGWAVRVQSVVLACHVPAEGKSLDLQRKGTKKREGVKGSRGKAAIGPAVARNKKKQEQVRRVFRAGHFMTARLLTASDHAEPREGGGRYTFCSYPDAKGAICTAQSYQYRVH